MTNLSIYISWSQSVTRVALEQTCNCVAFPWSLVQ